MNTIHPIANPETGECGDSACPCHGFTSKLPSGASRPDIEPVGFLAPEAKNALSGDSEPVEAIPAPSYVLYIAGIDCQVFHSEDRQCPVCEGGLAVCRNCKEYEAGLDNPCKPSSSTAIPAPDFEREWAEAPRAMRNYVEREIAEYWFLRGLRAGEVKASIESTETFRAMAEQRGLGR